MKVQIPAGIYERSLEVGDEAAIDGKAESFVGKEGFSHSISDLESATDKISSQKFIDFVKIMTILVFEEKSGLGTNFVVGTQRVGFAVEMAILGRLVVGTLAIVYRPLDDIT